MRYYAMILIMAAAVALTGCETQEGTPYRTGTGAIIGAGAGAASGAVIAGGHNAPEGALIGGVVGAIGGGLIGNALDQQERARLQAQAPMTYARIDQDQPLGLQDVKAMAQAGISDNVIISQMRTTGTAYHLSASDIIDLHTAGVSETVINYMVNSASIVTALAPQATPVVVAQPPPPPVQETLVVAPAPGYVWVGGEWVWNGGRWVWAPGHWAAAPYRGAVWVRGGWYHTPRGWHHYSGRWG
jgi:surface antigen